MLFVLPSSTCEARIPPELMLVELGNHDQIFTDHFFAFVVVVDIGNQSP